MYQVLAITGYKPHELGIFNEKHAHLSFLKYALKKKMQQLIEEYDIEWIMTSGQAGVELWAAEAAIELKETYDHLKIATIAPFQNQEERLGDATKELYFHVWNNSDYSDFVTKRTYDNPMQLRLKNQFIVEKSHALLVLFDEYTEGTPTYYLTNAKKKAETNDYPIFFLTPDEIEDVTRELQDEDNSWN
ncbi:DUF1273 domain-containing protein [Evansella cellulosilytica]|uniref:Uncharacterized protein n=1 Tax=Evansella cellulosilytica (strain ATCC 21833 / DSM 2522 / FERM P-1141 / JCM 9156 / N-4) TaxID=649639 RepID=E6U288_EVAC2|nr:DUF1273 domain-containing protein [Evansella cellulosilytica]ADU30466.1 protein of unknown function DUF1273 [Evansella cellulosilytica DSM 2522]